MDFVEFSWRCIGEPKSREYHEYCSHYHLDYNIPEGQTKFRAEINRIFRRAGVVYELAEQGAVRRLTDPVLLELHARAEMCTGDHELNRLLATAQEKLQEPDENKRRESLEALWDAWERLKTLGVGNNKKEQVEHLLACTAGSEFPLFQQILEADAGAVTNIGNQLRIRHSEVGQEKPSDSAHVDYLFYRLFSLITLILRRLQAEGRLPTIARQERR